VENNLKEDKKETIQITYQNNAVFESLQTQTPLQLISLVNQFWRCEYTTQISCLVYNES